MSYLEFLSTYGGRFVDGAIVTAQQTGLATVVAVSIAVLVGLMRLARNPLLIKLIRRPSAFPYAMRSGRS